MHSGILEENHAYFRTYHSALQRKDEQFGNEIKINKTPSNDTIIISYILYVNKYIEFVLFAKPSSTITTGLLNFCHICDNPEILRI